MPETRTVLWMRVLDRIAGTRRAVGPGPVAYQVWSPARISISFTAIRRSRVTT
jgi:hypothetical protein